MTQFWTWQNACMNASMDVIDCIKIKFVWSTLFQWTKWTIEIRFDPSLVIQVISICFTRIKNVIMHNCLNQNLRITYYSLFMRHRLSQKWAMKLRQEYFPVTRMLVTDVGGRMCWWQVWDLGDRFRMLVTDLIHWKNHQHNGKSHQHNDSGTNI